MRQVHGKSRHVAKLGINCGHCGRLIEDDDVEVVLDDDELIHVLC